jgi:hypothetical protein
VRVNVNIGGLALCALLSGCAVLGMSTNRFVATNNGAAPVQVVFFNRGCGEAQIWLDQEWSRRRRRDVKPRIMNPVGSWGQRMRIKLPEGPHTFMLILETRHNTRDGQEVNRSQYSGSFRAVQGAEIDLCK